MRCIYNSPGKLPFALPPEQQEQEVGLLDMAAFRFWRWSAGIGLILAGIHLILRRLRCDFARREHGSP